MSEVDRIIAQLQRGLEGGAWHGPALLELLTDITAERAAARPHPAAHSIWEIVNHLAAWQDIVRRRLEGERVDTEAVGETEDWPPVRAPTSEDWQAAKGRLTATHARLQSTAAAFPPERLDERPNGGGDTFYAQLHGVVQHDLYHAGQIALLKKLDGKDAADGTDA